MTTIDQQVRTLYTGGDVTVIPHELRTVIEAAITNQPRSLQKRIGPSEIGNPCDRCLISKLGGIEEQRDVAWLPYIGSAVHMVLEEVLIAHEHTLAPVGGRYLMESTVNVGRIGGQDITGHADLFDTRLGVVIDYKTVGATTLRDAKANGASAVYRAQAHLYGKGFEDAGYTVQAVAIWYLPRNEPTLANALFWHEPYDRAIAEKALARADMYATAITALGLDTVLANATPHIGGHSCHRFADGPPSKRDGHPTTASLLNLATSKGTTP